MWSAAVSDIYDRELDVPPGRVAARAPAEESRNTPPETGVGGQAYQAPAPILNLVPVRCTKVWQESDPVS